MTHEIELKLTRPQMLKLTKQATFQVKPDASEGEPNVLIGLHSKADFNRYMRSIKNGRGYRFQANSFKVLSDIDGGSLFKKARKFAKKHKVGQKLVNFGADRLEAYTGIQAETSKNIAKKAQRGDLRGAKGEFDTAANQYAEANAKGRPAQGGNLIRHAKKAAKKEFNKQASAVKEKVRGELGKAKEATKEATKTFLTNAVSTGVPGMVAAATLAAAPEAAWAVPIAASLASKRVAEPLNRRIETAIDGLGVGANGKKLVKGSAEAKAHMAALRAKRGAHPKHTGVVVGQAVPGKPKPPVGNSTHARLDLVKPDILRNKGVKGGSFRPSGGSFKVSGEGNFIDGGSFMPS